MKKLIPVLVILLNLGLVLTAQNLTIENLSGVDITNTTVIATGGVADAEIVEYMKVKNLSGNNIEVIFKKKNITGVAGTTNDFCVGFSCYPATSMFSNPFVVMAGMLQTEETSCHYRPHGFAGSSTIRYTFYDQNNPNDSASAIVEFVVTSVINEANVSALEVYPNPAVNTVNFDYHINNTNNSWFTVYNMLGNVVKSVRLEKSSANISVPVDDLESGIYFYSVMVNEEAIKTSRLIINR
ncbi:MAG: T9SS type A sorting domain-containing protein [Haliscomenobacter sp.]|nr:T9SS type A sorting domain-containing protein [Haliscomenobacter sp.]